MTFLLLGKKRAEEQLRFEIQIDSRPARFLSLLELNPLLLLGFRFSHDTCLIRLLLFFFTFIWSPLSSTDRRETPSEIGLLPRHPP